MHLVTGGAGFIGSNLVRRLAAHTGGEIIVVDDLSDGQKFRNIAGLSVADYLDKDEFLQCIERGDSYLKQVSAVLHQGACSVTTEWNGRYMMQNNFSYSRTLLHYCLSARLPFIYASSAAVYGSSDRFSESAGNEKPLNVYGYSKLLFDRYVRRLDVESGQQVVGLRYFNVYGPGESHKGPMASVAHHFDRELRSDGEVRLFEGSGGYGDGEQRRDFVHVDDVCAVILWFIEHRDVSGIFNVGTGRAQTFNDVANAVIHWHGNGQIRYIPFPPHLKGVYQSYTQADLGALRNAGCDTEFRDVATGVRDYLDAQAEGQP